MTETFFRALSYIFHPLLMPLMAIYLLLELPTMPNSLYLFDALCFYPDEVKVRLYLVMGVLTLVAPLLSVMIMYWNRMVTSLHMEKREERFYPYIIVTFYFILAYSFLRYQWPEKLQHPALLSFLFGMIVINVILIILNFRYKVSAHAAAIFGVCGLLIAYNQTQLSRFVEIELPNLGFILVFVIISGLVVTGRLVLKAHTIGEVLTGMLIGFTVMYSFVKFGIYY